MEEKEALFKEFMDAVDSMMEERIVDSQFKMVCSLEETTGFSLEDVITNFCDETQKALNELTEAMKETVWDYYVIKMHAYKVKRCALCLGARRLTWAFSMFQRAIEKKSKEFCLISLTGAKQEYSVLEEKLQALLQLEKKLVLCLEKQKKKCLKNTSTCFS